VEIWEEKSWNTLRMKQVPMEEDDTGFQIWRWLMLRRHRGSGTPRKGFQGESRHRNIVGLNPVEMLYGKANGETE
jgi:hypothetical protein